MSTTISKLYTLITLLFFTSSCATSQETQTQSKKKEPHQQSNLLTGFNQNWRYLPSLDNTTFINNIKELAPQTIRYPGGTVTHGWHWRTGTHKDPLPEDFIHPIEDVKKLVDLTGVKIVFDLDVVYSTLEDQLAMLEKANALGVDVEFIELGNELYSRLHGYEKWFPDGNAYADTVNVWVPKIRAAFPKAKIAAVHIGKPGTNQRQLTWNEQTAKRIKDIDAFTYHIYIPEKKDFEFRKKQFLDVYYNPDNKPVWVTEYGNMANYNSPGYLENLKKLVDFVESYPPITMALNHAMVSAGINRSKLTRKENGTKFTDEGKMFIEIAKERSK